VIDKKGNQGKGWFARYYEDFHDNAKKTGASPAEEEPTNSFWKPNDTAQ
jgi:hypothetical protein